MKATVVNLVFQHLLINRCDVFTSLTELFPLKQIVDVLSFLVQVDPLSFEEGLPGHIVRLKIVKIVLSTFQFIRILFCLILLLFRFFRLVEDISFSFRKRFNLLGVNEAPQLANLILPPVLIVLHVHDVRLKLLDSLLLSIGHHLVCIQEFCFFSL